MTVGGTAPIRAGGYGLVPASAKDSAIDGATIKSPCRERIITGAKGPYLPRDLSVGK